MRKITEKVIEIFKIHLVNEEKSQATIEKYIRDINTFLSWLGDRELTKHLVVEYKNILIERYAPASTNSMLSSINSFFTYMEWYDCRVKTFKVQKQIFANEDRELSKKRIREIIICCKANEKGKIISSNANDMWNRD